MDKIKKKRRPNFTNLETEILIDLVFKYKSVVENKKTDATTWKDKSDIWETITAEFNANSGNFPRTVKTGRAKYETIKKEVRKTCAKYREEIMKTGGGVIQCPISKPYEEKLISITQIFMLGLSSRFDNDVTEPEWQQRDYIDVDDDDNIDNLRECQLTENITPDVLEKSLETDEGTEEIRIEYVSNDAEIASFSCLGKAGGKFIYKNKTTRGRVQKNYIKQNTEAVELKKSILELQKDVLNQEIAQKNKINELILENLKKDLELKELQIKALKNTNYII